MAAPVVLASALATPTVRRSVDAAGAVEARSKPAERRKVGVAGWVADFGNPMALSTAGPTDRDEAMALGSDRSTDAPTATVMPRRNPMFRSKPIPAAIDADRRDPTLRVTEAATVDDAESVLTNSLPTTSTDDVANDAANGFAIPRATIACPDIVAADARASERTTPT
jgi:hypothetical protein